MTEPQDPKPNYPAYPGAEQAKPAATPAPPGSGPSSYPQQPGSVHSVDGRPGSVLAAGITTIVLSVLTLVTALGTFAATNDFVDTIQDYIRDHPSDFNFNASDLPTDSDIKGVLTGLAVTFLIVGVVGIVLGMLTIAGQNWARITLIVTSSLTAVAAILPTIVLIGLPWLAGSITVIVLLLTAKSKAWFAAPKVA